MFLPYQTGRIGLTVMAAAISQGVFAQQTPDAGAPAGPVAVVTVSAGRGVSLQQMDLATTVLSQDQVQNSPGTTIDQILNKIPGIYLRQIPAAMIHPTGEAFSIRGFGTTTNVNTLAMADGIPINDPFFRTIDWGQLSKDSIDSIEVIRGGGASTLWGNLAMGGIVNVVTRAPLPDERRINVSYGSFNTTTADAALTLLSNQVLTLGLTAGWAKSDGYNLTPVQYRNPYMVPTASHTDNLGLTAYLTPSATSKYFIKLQQHESKEDGLVWSDTSNRWKKYQLSAGGATRLDGGASINLAGWYNKGEMDTTNNGTTPSFSILNPGVGVPYVSQIEQANYSSEGGSVFYQRSVGDFKDVRVGVDLRQVRSDDDLNIYNTVARTAALENRGNHRFEGVFAQASYRPADLPFDITAGLREDFFQTRNGQLSGTVGSNQVGSDLANQTSQHFDPRLGGKYYLPHGFDLRAAVYSNFAAPGMNQMYRSFVSGTSYTATNPTLTPQTNVGKEIGLDYVQPGLNVNFTVYDNKLKNFIDYGPLCTTAAACTPLLAGTGFAPGSITTVNQYLNAGDATFKGAELMADWQLKPDWQVHGGLTRTMAYLTSSAYAALPSAAAPAVPVHAQIGQVPGWMVTAGTTWKVNSALNLMLESKTFPNYWNNTAHTQINQGATLVNLGFRYRLNRQFDLYGSAQNLFNRTYYDNGLGYTTMNGATLSSSTIPQLGQPLSVTLGVRASF
ncbi:MAG TPA: TonB-dependent receptor [Janthinobacterium sp.]|nr:TonB-dependent receptor [Janthinobacterium sp.]